MSHISLLSKVKGQRTRLRRFLLENLGARELRVASTGSEYYTLGNLNIRVSDHSSSTSNKYLNIYIPFNDPSIFIIENNHIMSTLRSLKEVKSLLQSLIFVSKLYSEVFNSSLSEQLVEAKIAVEKLTSRNEALVKINSKLIISKSRLENAIILKGVSYPIDERMPGNFKRKIKRVLNGCRIQPI